MNNWYSRIIGQPATQQMSGANFMNPIQKAQYIMQSLTNPAAFVKQQFPDIPDAILNDPNQILAYLQQSRGISNQQLQQLMYGGNNYGNR